MSFGIFKSLRLLVGFCATKTSYTFENAKVVWRLQ
jgi:hypothetical protein